MAQGLVICASVLSSLGAFLFGALAYGGRSERPLRLGHRLHRAHLGVRSL